MAETDPITREKFDATYMRMQQVVGDTPRDITNILRPSRPGRYVVAYACEQGSARTFGKREEGPGFSDDLYAEMEGNRIQIGRRTRTSILHCTIMGNVAGPVEGLIRERHEAYMGDTALDKYILLLGVVAGMSMPKDP